MSYVGVNADDRLIGTTLAGRYRIEERVGSGAMGSVYRAVQAGLGRNVALKVLKRDLAWGGDTVQRFRREAQAMSALHHPNTVRVFDFGATESGVLYLAMELLEGESATDRLASGPLPIAEAILIAQEVLRSIGEAHAKGIVHRDLKPDNIFLARVEGRDRPMTKVLDFGIAKAIEGERKIDQFETLDGTVFGTPRYMSPEQASGKALDPRSDLYAVGILLYELIAGRPPFVDADAVVVMAKHIREEPAPLSKLVTDRVVPRRLESAVNKALAKSPDKRFQSAEAFDHALAECMIAVERVARAPWLTHLQSRRVQLVAASVCSGALLFGLWPRTGREPTGQDARSGILVAGDAISTAESTTTASATSTAATRAQGEQAARRIVTLQSEPREVEVWRDGTLLGVTPLEVVVMAGQTQALRLHKTGFLDHTVELSGAEVSRRIELSALPKARKPTRRERTRRPRASSTSTAPRAKTPAKPGTQPPAQPARDDSPYEKF